MVEALQREQAFFPPKDRLNGTEQIIIYLPFSDMMPEGIYEEDNVFKATVALLSPTGRHIPPERLNFVKALGLLTNISSDPENQYFLPFDHTRFFHTLIVARTGERILQANGASEQDIKTFVASAILHDAATPALGDATKAIDPKNLDEEEFWYEEVDEKGWNYLRSIGATREKIDDIIKNKDVLGKVLDIADRIGYVTRDAYFFYDPAAKILLSNYPKIGDIYKDVVVDFKTGEIYFKNAERLGAFLLLRSILHKDLYLHPINIGRDLKFANLLGPYYSVTEQPGKLTPKMLREMTDDDLMEWIEKAKGLKPIMHGDSYFDLIRWLAHFERYETLEEAEKAKERLEKQPKTEVVGIRESRGFNPATSYKTLNDEGQIVEYKEAEPEQAKMLELMMESTKAFYLFYSKNN